MRYTDRGGDPTERSGPAAPTTDAPAVTFVPLTVRPESVACEARPGCHSTGTAEDGSQSEKK
jgi:hypothetical protein